MEKPDLGTLLSKIPKKHASGELTKTEVQHVQPVKTAKSKNVQEEKRQISKTPKQENTEARGAGGRPSVKQDDIEYTKISPRIPKSLKKTVEHALTDERFADQAGRRITTLDEIVALALERLLK